jgi:hypothetical protein
MSSFLIPKSPHLNRIEPKAQKLNLKNNKQIELNSSINKLKKILKSCLGVGTNKKGCFETAQKSFLTLQRHNGFQEQSKRTVIIMRGVLPETDDIDILRLYSLQNIFKVVPGRLSINPASFVSISGIGHLNRPYPDQVIRHPYKMSIIAADIKRRKTT